MSALPIDTLVADLRTELCGARRGKLIVELLCGYAERHEDWRPFALFDEECYTRNRIALDDEFELLLLCWGPGQTSPIHGHEGQDCWMAVLEGEVEEQRFDFPTGGLGAPMEPKTSAVFRKREVAYIRDDMGLHLVRQAGPAPAVSLHLYATPYAECDVYDTATGSKTRRALCDYSVRGERVLAT